MSDLAVEQQQGVVNEQTEPPEPQTFGYRGRRTGPAEISVSLWLSESDVRFLRQQAKEAAAGINPADPAARRDALETAAFKAAFAVGQIASEACREALREWFLTQSTLDALPKALSV